MEDDKRDSAPKLETPATVETPGTAESMSASPPSIKKKKKKKKTAEGGPLSADPMSLQPETVPEGERAKKKKKKKKALIDPNSPARVDAQTLDRNLGKIKAKVDANEAARAGFPLDPDESSIPPVVEDHFFTTGEAPKMATAGMSGSFAGLDPRHAQKLTAEAAARRAHLSRYVKGAIAFCALVMVIGFVRVAFFPSKTHNDVRVSSSQVTIPEALPPQKVEPKVPVDVPAVPTDTAQVIESAPITDIDETAGDAKPNELMEKEPLPVDQPPAKTAAQEKATAKAALESGANGTAIAAGERSVALDSSDGETWLILGAAYQASGNQAAATRCFKACISQGRRGPIDECKQMLAQ